MQGNPQRTIRALVAPAIAMCLMVGVTACQERKYGQYRYASDKISLSAGDAIAHNKAVQTIDPWPAHSRRKTQTMDGERALLGMKRYQENKSIEPEGLGTSKTFEDNQQPPAAPPAGSP